MITHVQALRYRCFDYLDIKWQRYNVLAGANGSGKSTLLDIPQLFSDMLSHGLRAAFLETVPTLGVPRAPRAQSLNELTHCYRGGDFGFVLEAELPEHIVSQLVTNASPAVQKNEKRWPRVIRYEIRFGVLNNTDLYVWEEYVWLIPQRVNERAVRIHFGGRKPQDWQAIIGRLPDQPVRMFFEIKPEQGRKDFALHLEPDKLALASLPHDSSLSPATVWFVEMLTRGTLAYNPNIAELHRACPPGQPKTMRADAANLPWMVLELKQTRRAMFEAWVAHVKTALPTIRAIDAVRREDDSYAYLKVEYEGGYTITSTGLSGGTLMILAMTILPYLSNPPELLCLEEPENGIYPRAIEAILQSLSSMYNSQVWVSTHSLIVLAHTDLSSLIIMRGDGNNGIQAISGEQHPRLDDWRGEIDLGTLFAAGVFE
jgi:predicted ATPase